MVGRNSLFSTTENENTKLSPTVLKAFQVGEKIELKGLLLGDMKIKAWHIVGRVQMLIRKVINPEIFHR